MTAAEYLNHCRIEKAKKLLIENHHLNVLDIAMTCGFESSQYFATVFKKKIGVTPSQYRETHSELLDGTMRRTSLLAVI